MTPTPQQPAKPEGADVLISIQFESPDEILKKETGLKLAQRIWNSQNVDGGDLNFFKARSLKWAYNEKWATGKQDTKEFMQFFNVSDGNKSYVAMDMEPIKTGAQFVGTLVQSMSKNEEYPCVTAIDDGSKSEKEQRKKDALHRMHNAGDILKLEDAGGMMIEPPNAYVPENELAAEVHFKLDDRLPKEIEREQKLERIQLKTKYQRVLKPKMTFDLIVDNCVATKVERDAAGQITYRKAINKKLLYSYFQNDSGEDELSWIGEEYSLKLRDIRRLYKGVTEKELFEIAKSASQVNVSQMVWRQEYAIYNYDRPWDDYAIPVFDFEIQININDYFVSKPDKKGNENIAPKNSRPAPTSSKATVAAKEKSRWYRGVYTTVGNKMLYWGLPDVVLVPFLNTEKALSSWSINIPFNQGGYVPSLFERGLEPLKEYTLTKLKRKQLISKLRPSGIRIDVESARNIDLGNGQTIAWEEVIRIFDHTGNELWSSRGLDPNQQASPALSATAQDDSIQKIVQLTEVMRSCIEELRALWGVPLFRDGGDVGDRTSGTLAEQQNTSSSNVTDYILNALNQVMEETLYKCCLAEWKDDVKNEKEPSDLVNTAFEVAVMMKPTDYQKQLLAQRIEIWSKTPDKYGNPLLSPKDVFYIEQIKDFKLAQLYLANTIEINRKKHMEESEQLQKQNSELQQQSAQQSAQAQQQLEQQKQQMIAMQEEAKAKGAKQEILLSGFMELLKTGLPIPPQLMPLFNAAMQNVAVPLVAETAEAQKEIQERMQAEQAQQEAQAQQAQQIQQIAQQQGIPPEQVAAQMQQQQQPEEQQEQQAA